MVADEPTLRRIAAANVRRLRLARGWSQEALAAEAGLHRTFVGHVERAETNISLDSLERFARALGVAASTLLAEGPNLEPTELGTRSVGGRKDSLEVMAGEAARKAQSCADLNIALAPGFLALGFQYFSVFETISDGERHVLRHICGRTHPAWHAAYVASRLYRHDIRVRIARQSTEPFFLSEALIDLDITAEERTLLELGSRYGVDDSYVFPTRDRDGRLYAAVLIGSGVPIDARVRANAHFLASIFVLSACRIERQTRDEKGAKSGLELPRRQLQCLEWARRGKTSAEIAQILGLSPRTVDEHLAAACRTLGVHKRVQAVCQALTVGLLPYMEGLDRRSDKTP